jgi:hypothetical protein
MDRTPLRSSVVTAFPVLMLIVILPAYRILSTSITWLCTIMNTPLILCHLHIRLTIRYYDWDGLTALTTRHILHCLLIASNFRLLCHGDIVGMLCSSSFCCILLIIRSYVLDQLTETRQSLLCLCASLLQHSIRGVHFTVKQQFAQHSTLCRREGDNRVTLSSG